MPQPHEEERTFAASAAANHHRMEGGRTFQTFAANAARMKCNVRFARDTAFAFKRTIAEQFTQTSFFV
ncbi:hypothetical protein [Phaeobacter inhibens]|uniref:hypothetical protein n=1 Tax=Phaeobacter inhibens TaxID=221822 RepID=UPI0021A75596|nr:hypothetical protein [Phaeobacter inhibens]UWR61398.1 hypothetical protein K4F88_03395 [Phaeobacter inhibens]